MTQLGSRGISTCKSPIAPLTLAVAFNRGASADAEQEYDRLRNLARQESDERKKYSRMSQEAYQRGDGAGAHEYSEKSKQHGANQDRYNKQASEFIFRENNGDHVPGDTIDLHGQFVEEAEEILEQRIRAGQSRGETHLHVIVGKGNHSKDHVQKIKPRVEQVCRDLGLKYQTEHNEGRIYVDLTGGEVHQMPPPPSGYGQQWGVPPYGGGGGYPGQQHGGGYAQQQQDEEVEQVVKDCMKLFRSCCVVMGTLYGIFGHTRSME
jgi:DNA-nicking Smr family endonuclease